MLGTAFSLTALDCKRRRAPADQQGKLTRLDLALFG